MAVTVRGDRGAFGGALTPPQASPLRLGALAARAASSALVSLGPNGDVVAGALTVGDMPLGSDWTWGTGTTITFAPGPLAVPAATSRSLGTRLVLEPVPGSTEYAIGRETGALWTSVPTLVAHKWYQGASERLRLETDGSLQLVNSVVGLRFSSTPAGEASVAATHNLYVAAGTGLISINTGAGLVSPFTGYRENLGQLTKKFLTLHAAELWVETLVAQNTMATIGGRILVGPTTTLMADLPASGAGAGPNYEQTIRVKHNQIQVGDWLWLEANGQFEIMQAVFTPGGTVPPFEYIVRRNRDGSGLSDWYAGDAVFNTGHTGSGFIDLYSVAAVNPGSTAGPTMVGNVRAADTATAWREHWAVGNLKGVYGNASTKYGAAFGDTAGMHLQIDATDGIRMLGSGGTGGVPYGHWDMSGNLSLGNASYGQLVYTAIDGQLALKFGGVEKIALRSDGSAHLNAGLVVGANAGAVGSVRSAGATDWNAGSGFLFKHTQATNLAVALIGDATGRRVQWDGASLKVVSDGLTIDENGITLQQQATGSYSATRAVQWTGGARLWDSSVNNAFELYRGSGEISVRANATAGTVVVQAGGASTDRTTLRLYATAMELGGAVAGGSPPFLPATDAVHNLGTIAKRWRAVNAVYHVSTFGAFGGASSFAYSLEVGADSAAKPLTNLWTVPSDRTIKKAIEPVDTRAALETVVRVPLVRYRLIATDEPGIGVVAQDVRDLLPLSVRARTTDGLLDWNAHELLILNVAAVQELAARVAALERTKTP